MRILVILGEGGHTVEMLRLLDLVGPKPEYEYHYFLVREETISEQRIRFAGPIYYGNRPHWKDENPLIVALKYVRLTLQSARALWRVRPRAILHSGPGIAIPAALLGKMAGAKVIYVENGARVHTLSRSGRLMYRVADLFFVQWPELKARWPDSIYAGSLHG
jgi:UDP-N-acetylglucosamine:LPS N-acetylglucosamine transferase